MAMTDNDALVLKIRADIKSLQAGLRQAGREAEIAGNTMQKNLATPMGKVQAAMTAGATAAKAAFLGISAAALTAGYAIAAITRRALETADGLVKMSDKTGVSIEALQRFRYAASQAGIGTDELDQGLAFFTRTLSDAATGAGNAAAVFQQLGVALSDESGPRRSEAIFRDVVAALERIEDPAQRAAASLDLFGKSGLNIGVIANQGAGYLARMEEEASRLGLVLGEDLVRSGDAAGDALDRLKLIITSGLTKAVLEAAPEIEKFVNELTSDPAKIQAFTNDLVEIAKGITTVAGAAAEAWHWVQLLGGALGQGLAKTKLDIAGIERPDAMDFPNVAPGNSLDRPDSAPGRPGPSINYTDPAKEKAQTERSARELDQQRKHNEALIQQTREFIATETALEEMKYQTRRAALMAANAEQFGGEEAKNQLLADLATKHQENLGAIEAQEEARATRDLERTQELLDAKKRAMEELAAYTMDYEEQAELYEQGRYENALAILEQQHSEELSSYEEFLKKKEELTTHYEENLRQIREANLQSGYQFLSQIQNKELRSAADYGAAAINIASAYSKKAFKLQKVLGIANAAMTAYQGANKALADGDSYTAILRAGAILAYGLANVAAISRTQMNGSVPGGGGGGSVYREPRDNNPGQAQSTNRGPSIALTLNGSNFSAEQVRQLIDQINEQIGDGANIG